MVDYQKMLQEEITKTQEYVNSKAISVEQYKGILEKEIDQLKGLQVKLQELQGKQDEWLEFQESLKSKKKSIVPTVGKNAKIKTGQVNAAEGVFTGILPGKTEASELNSNSK